MVREVSVDKKVKAYRDKSDIFLILWTFIPVVAGVALIIAAFWLKDFTILLAGGLLLGYGVGTNNGMVINRRLMLKFLGTIGIKVEGKRGREIITYYLPTS